MGDDYKDFKRGKPQQKLYKPGSGPLRRSGYGLDAKMDSFELSRSRDRIHYGSRNSLNGEEGNTATREQSNTRHKKPEQQLYVARNADSNTDVDRHSKRCDNSSQYNNRRNSSRPEKHGFSAGTFPKGSSKRDRYAEYQSREGLNTDINYNRNYRQQSETRSTSPTHCNKEQNMSDRNRDSRSMETSTGRHMSGAGGKPPSGRRNSAGYPGDSSRPPKHMINLDNLPPRFRKKYLEQQSVLHSFDSVDHINRDRQVTNNAFHSSSFNHNQPLLHNSHAGWSQTLPSRGRGRLKDNEGFDREKFISTYLRNNDINNSRRSTPSSSYMNLYEPNAIENRRMNDDDSMTSSYTSQKDIYDDGTMINKNGIGMTNNDDHNHKLDMSEDQNISHNISETISHISSTLMDMTNLDWTEEVEKNINLEDACDSSTSFSQNINPTVTQDIKPVESKESKRSGKSRRDRRSSSRGHRNSDKRSERYRKDSNVSVQHEPERNRKDSSVSLQHETVGGSMKQKERDKTRKDSNVNLQHEASRQRERCRKDSNASLQHEAIVSSVKHAGRERRDSHKSNRSSTLGNSRDDLDRWRSLRSYSREHSTERRIVSQCNSRDPSANRALSPRDHDGFRMPTAVPKQSNTGNGNHKKNNGARTASTERGRQSPAPEPGSRARKAKRSSRRRHRHAEPPGAAPAPNSNWREEILESKKHDKPSENTHQRNRLNSAMSEKSESSTSHPGIIILPQSTISHMQKDQVRCGSVENQKHLFDHHNPSKPIIVQTSPTKVDMRMERGVKEASARGATSYESGDAARAARHRALLQEVDRADAILQTHMLRSPVSLADHWTDVGETRKLLQNALQKLLMSDLKYCQADNVEHNFWKILYYNFIEILRKSFSQVSPEDKKKIVTILNVIIDEGNSYFENLIQMLEKTYKFNTDDYINDNHLLPPKGMGYVGLALISVQKLYVFLGDLARYKEQVNETNNYAKSKYWYTKAQQINPKNGRPYNQLAILAIYARRKLDAVYYYMRSLMSSNPFHSARESLISLFDENRKKYEIAERKRRAALETCKSEGSDTSISGSGSGSGVKREVWVRPSGHRTTVQPDNSSPKENLAAMSNVELNKNFITSYLHVHGKLITKIGMETFYESAGVMLRQFRALLQRQPLPTPAARLLQLTALNMFAVETNSHQKGENSTGERSASLECALGVSLLMFGALVERCCALLPEPVDTQQHTDARTLLPAVKVWSDWMLCHSSVWNPPPSFEHFEIQTDNDPWDWLANLMNILERLDDKSIEFENESKEGYVAVRLCEDASLAGFTPLMYMEPAAAWTRDSSAPHDAEHALRARKLLFFGTEYLVGVEPPVLSLEYPAGGAAGGAPRYVRALRPAHAPRPPLQNLCEDSEEDSTSGPGDGVTSASETGAVTDADDATRRLLRRKEQLETRRAHLERRKQRMQEILGGGGASVDVEVRPRWLVPDTNCFIDHLRLLQALVAPPTMPYQLAVPLVVVSELKGLGKCSRLGENARAALEWIQGGGSGVRLATTKGSLLASRAFTDESDLPRGSNDDRVLTTALSLQDVLSLTAVEPQDTDSKCRVREVVLLTDDRNLRVKALAAEVPARELRAFVQWAGVSDDATDKSTEKPATGLK